MIEKFNDHYRQKFLGKITMTSMMELQHESLALSTDITTPIATARSRGKHSLKNLITHYDEPESFGHGIMIFLSFSAFTER